MSGPILHKIMHHPMVGKVMVGVLEDRLGGAVSLSVSAPSALAFAVGDQPYQIYDWDAHNLMPNSDMAGAVVGTTAPTGWQASDVAVITGVSTDGNGDSTIEITASGAVAYIRDFITVEDQSVVAVSVDYNLTSGSTRYIDILSPLFQALNWFNDGVAVSGTATVTAPQSGTVTVYVENSDALLEVRMGSSLGANTCVIEVSKPYVRLASSPDEYVQTTGSVVAPVAASDGGLQFADSQYDGGADSYTVTLTAGGTGDLTLINPSNGGNWSFATGDGTDDATMTFTATLDRVSWAVGNLELDNYTVGSSTITGTLTHDATGRSTSFNMSVSVTADPSFLLMSDGSSRLLLSDGTSLLKLSA